MSLRKFPTGLESMNDHDIFFAMSDYIVWINSYSHHHVDYGKFSLYLYRVANLVCPQCWREAPMLHLADIQTTLGMEAMIRQVCDPVNRERFGVSHS